VREEVDLWPESMSANDEEAAWRYEEAKRTLVVRLSEGGGGGEVLAAP
jgi:hypothetical protein